MNTNTVVGLSLGLGLGGCFLALLIGGLIFYFGCCDTESSREGAEESSVEVGGIPLRSKAPKLSPEELELRETAIRRYKRRLRREALEKRREEARLKKEALKEAASLSAQVLVPTLLQSKENYPPSSDTKKQKEGETNVATNNVPSTADNQSALFHEMGGAAALHSIEDRTLESEEDSESQVSCDTSITASTDAYGRAVYEAERETGFSRGISSRCSSFVSEGFNSFRLDSAAMRKRESFSVDPHSSVQGGGNQNRSHQRTMERKRRQRLHAEQFSTAAMAQHFSNWEGTYDPFDEVSMEGADTRMMDVDVEERQAEREGLPYTSYAATPGSSGMNVSHLNPHVSFTGHDITDSGEVEHTNQNFILSAAPNRHSHVSVSLSSSFTCRENEARPNASKEIPQNGSKNTVLSTACSTLDPLTQPSLLHSFPAAEGVASRRGEDHHHPPVSQSTTAVQPPPHSDCLSVPSPEVRVKHSDPSRRPEGHVEENIAISGFFRSQLAPLPPISMPTNSPASS